MFSTSSLPAFKAMNAAELDRLISEVARRHHILIDRNDPILVTVTLNELVLERMVARIEAGAQAARAEIAAGAAQQIEAAKTIASRLITAAAGYADEQFRLAAKSAADDLKAELSKRGQSPADAGAITNSRTGSASCWTAAFISFAATATALIAILLPLAFLQPQGDCGVSASGVRLSNGGRSRSPIALAVLTDSPRWR
jgi:hypothetical protein